MENKLSTDFTSYEQALALKELGFNERCLMCYYNQELVFTPTPSLNTNSFWAERDSRFITAPLKSQVFRWLYGKVNKWIIPIPNDDKKGEWYGHGVSYKSLEEAENACIDKLIEIAKQQVIS